MSDQAQRPETDPPAPVAAPQPEPTGVIDVGATQAISTPAPAAPAPSPSTTPPAGEATGEDGWFDQFAGQHPADGSAVPPRADAAWGSDRADALAEQNHVARYLPPGEGAGAAAASGTGWPAPSSSPQSSQGGGPGSVGFVPLGATDPPGPPALPAGPAGPAQRRSGRGLIAAVIVAVALVSGIVGGVAGQLLGDRVRLGGSSLPQPGPGSTARPAGSVANIAATALPSVVTIKIDAGKQGSGTGSGFVIDTKGHVLTNNHVVGAAANGGSIEVVLSNGDTEKATIVGRDVSYDLAVLKIERTDLTPLTLGESNQVVVGDQVIAVGAPLGLDQTVTTGIVSALNRPVSPGAGDEASYINAIQTDAAINPGNSGGPLLDTAGKVIGINSAIARVPGTTSSSGGNIGLGFAIPSDQARRTADQLIATGKSTHPVIGVNLDRTFNGEGAQVIDSPDAVVPDGPAAKAGIQRGDVITAFEGKQVRTPDQLIVSIRSRAVGDTVTLKVKRGGQELELKMTLEADPQK